MFQLLSFIVTTNCFHHLLLFLHLPQSIKSVQKVWCWSNGTRHETIKCNKVTHVCFFIPRKREGEPWPMLNILDYYFSILELLEYFILFAISCTLNWAHQPWLILLNWEMWCGLWIHLFNHVTEKWLRSSSSKCCTFLIFISNLNLHFPIYKHT